MRIILISFFFIYLNQFVLGDNFDDFYIDDFSIESNGKNSRSGILFAIFEDSIPKFQNISISAILICDSNAEEINIADNNNYHFKHLQLVRQWHYVTKKPPCSGMMKYVVTAFSKQPHNIISVLSGQQKIGFHPYLNSYLFPLEDRKHISYIMDSSFEILKKKDESKYSKTLINNNQKVYKGILIFEDNFDKINWTKWDYDIKMPLDTEDANFVSFQNLKENLYIKNGNLYILPKLLTEVTDYNDEDIRTGTLNLGNNCTGTVDRNLECQRDAFAFRILPPIVSSRIRTKHKFTFKYGVIEIRAKLPKGDWLFPQLFLEPSLNLYGISGYSSGQIRLAFIRSNEILDSKDGIQIDGYRLYGGVVLAQDEKFRELWMKNTLRKRNHFGDDYHVYKTIWTDEYLSFHLDGVEYGRLNGSFAYDAFDVNGIQHAEYWKTGNKMAPFDQEFFLSFGISAGGISDFPDLSTSGKRELDQKPWINSDPKNELNFWNAKNRWHHTWNGENAALKIDYVRVWAL